MQPYAIRARTNGFASRGAAAAPGACGRAASRRRVVGRGSQAVGPTRRLADRIRGFTLLELLVTLVVAAIVVTIGVPSFRGIVQNNRVTTQTNELVTALNLARAEAVKRGRRVHVVVELETAGWSARVALVSAPDDHLRVIDRAGSAITVNAGTVTFLPTGVPLAPVGPFTMEPTAACSGMLRREITIAPSGQITTTREACG